MMKKITVVMGMTLAMVFFMALTWYSQGEAYDYHGCYQKWNGQLRVLTNYKGDPNKCENPPPGKPPLKEESYKDNDDVSWWFTGRCRPFEVMICWDEMGPPGLIWQGPWSDAITYELDDAVSYNGSSYISLVGSNIGNPPDISPTFWEVLAQKGEEGPQGADGHNPALTWSGDQIAIDGVVTGPHLTGPKGDNGLDGAPGKDGAPGIPGLPGMDGHSPVLSWSGDQIAIDGEVTGPHLIGPQGPEGLPGSQGPQGPAGEPARSYAPGLISVDDYYDCSLEDKEKGLMCSNKSKIGVTLPEHASMVFDVFYTDFYINNEEQEVTVEVVTHIEIYRPPRPGSTCRSNAVEFVLKTNYEGINYTASFCVSPDSPVSKATPVPGTYLEFLAVYPADSLILLTTPKPAFVQQVTTRSMAEITNISASYENGPDSAQLNVTFKNISNFAANYLVTVTGFTGCVEPVAAQWSFLDIKGTGMDSHTLSFGLHRCDDAGFPGDSATVRISSPDGYIYDSHTFSF